MKTKLFLTAMIAAAAMLPLWSCSDESESNPERRQIEMSRAEAESVADLTDFSFKMFDLMVKESAAVDKNANVAFSPVSASFALGMLANGVEGQTRAEMLKTILGNENAGVDELNAVMTKLMTELPGLDPRIDIKMGNSLWYKSNTLSISDAMLNALQQSYAAMVKCNDLVSPDAVAEINNWGLSVSGGMIPTIHHTLDGIFATHVFFNLLCFDGKWAERFDKSLTAPADFHSADGTVTRVDMMSSGKKKHFAYTTDNYVAVSLPYSSGAYNMDLFLPQNGATVASLAAYLADCGWREHSSGKWVTGFEVALPKFHVETESNLTEILRAAGITKLFERSDDFAPMWSGAGFEFGICQNVTVDVDEEGTKVAVVSKNKGDGSSFSDLVKFDEPFIYVIHEVSTGAVILAGAINSL